MKKLNGLKKRRKKVLSASAGKAANSGVVKKERKFALVRPPAHPSLKVIVSTRVRAHGSGQQFGSKLILVAAEYGLPFLIKVIKFWLL